MDCRNVAVLYLDDIIVYSKNFEEHFRNLSVVFDRPENANLKLKAKKCSFFKQEVTFLGHIVSREGVKTDPSKARAVIDWKIPQSVTELRAKIAKCLHGLTSKNTSWSWTAECDEAFNHLKST